MLTLLREWLTSALAKQADLTHLPLNAAAVELFCSVDCLLLEQLLHALLIEVTQTLMPQLNSL